MATALQNLIDAYIKRNANQEITGPVLNGVLTAIANALGTPFVGSDGYWYTYDAETGQFVKTDTPAQGETGPVGVTEAAATIDDQIGTPSVAVSLNGTRLDFAFRNLKGQKGDTGDAGITAAIVTVDSGIGTPSVDASISGTTLTLAFHNLKGETGAAAGFGTIEATVDDTTGTPAVVVTESGPDTAKNLSFAFSGLKGPKGDQGNTGVSADYPITIANNLTTDDPTAALAASQGVVLKGEIDQLGQKVDDISTGKYYGYYATAADLPETGVDGFAYVGSGPTYTIYNRRSGTWASSGVTVNQSPIGNEEDIDQNASGKLQFADRVYDAQQPDGMGYVILRKNKTFAEQVTEANTIYEIRYNFNLGGISVTIPDGCVLNFTGGSIKNGTLSGNNTILNGDIRFDVDVNFTGTFNCQRVDPRWFGAVSAVRSEAGYSAAQDFSIYATPALRLVEASGVALYIPSGDWVVKTPIVWTPSFVKIEGDGGQSIICLYTQTGDYPICFDFGGYTKSGYIRDISFVRQYFGDDFTAYRGTIFENVVFSSVIISGVRGNAMGIFIRGQVSNVTKIINCQISGIGYSFISAYSESEYDTAPADAGGKFCCVDSVIVNNYINSINTNVSGRITKEKAVFSGAVSSTTISNNYFDFWKYIFRKNVATGDSIEHNVVDSNVFDYCFSFGKKYLYFDSCVFTNNMIWHCYYNPNSSWGLYASNDEDIVNKKWCFFVVAGLDGIIIKNNEFKNGDFAFLNVYGAYPARFCDVDFPEKYILKAPIIASNYEDDGVDVYINKNKITRPDSSHLLEPYRLKSIVPANRKESADKTTFEFGDEYYPITFANPAYGVFLTADLYDFPNKIQTDFLLYTVILGNFNNSHKLYLEEINGENIWVIRDDTRITGVLYHTDLYKISSLLALYSVCLVLDLGVYVIYMGNNEFDYYYGIGENGATRGELKYTTLPASAQIGRVAVTMDGDTPVWHKYGYDGWIDDVDSIKKFFPKKNHGTTANRPYTGKFVGMEYLDETLGKKLMWNGSSWVNMDGTALS